MSRVFLPRRRCPQAHDRRHHPARHRLRPALERCEDRLLLAAPIYTVNVLTDLGTSNPPGTGPIIGIGSGTTGDLRYCITQADKTGGTINIALTGTINLSSLLPAIISTQPITITGPGANALTIVGVPKPTTSTLVEGGVFDITTATTATITGLTISGGNAAVGGGINRAVFY